MSGQSFPQPAFPQAEPKPPLGMPAGPGQMEYLRSFQYIFENPNWFLNLLFSFLCNLAGQVIPIAPAMVIMGYQFEICEELRLNGGKRYSDFDINRLIDYLARGVWPVLVLLMLALLSAVVLVPLFFATLVCSGAIGNAVGGEDATGPFIVIGLVAFLFLGAALAAALSVYATPMMLRAAYQQDIGAAFQFGWVNDFVGKVWLETLLSGLFLIFSVVALTLVTCGLAGLVLGPMMPFASAHLTQQLYSLYLSRGGTPIVFKPSARAMLTQPVVAGPPPGYQPPKY